MPHPWWELGIDEGVNRVKDRLDGTYGRLTRSDRTMFESPQRSYVRHAIETGEVEVGVGETSWRQAQWDGQRFVVETDAQRAERQATDQRARAAFLAEQGIVTCCCLPVEGPHGPALLYHPSCPVHESAEWKRVEARR